MDIDPHLKIVFEKHKLLKRHRDCIHTKDWSVVLQKLDHRDQETIERLGIKQDSVLILSGQILAFLDIRAPYIYPGVFDLINYQLIGTIKTLNEFIEHVIYLSDLEGVI